GQAEGSAVSTVSESPRVRAQQTVLAGEEEAECPLGCQASGADAEDDIDGGALPFTGPGDRLRAEQPDSTVLASVGEHRVHRGQTARRGVTIRRGDHGAA